MAFVSAKHRGVVLPAMIVIVHTTDQTVAKSARVSEASVILQETGALTDPVFPAPQASSERIVILHAKTVMLVFCAAMGRWGLERVSRPL